MTLIVMLIRDGISIFIIYIDIASSILVSLYYIRKVNITRSWYFSSFVIAGARVRVRILQVKFTSLDFRRPD